MCVEVDFFAPAKMSRAGQSEGRPSWVLYSMNEHYTTVCAVGGAGGPEERQRKRVGVRQMTQKEKKKNTHVSPYLYQVYIFNTSGGRSDR